VVATTKFHANVPQRTSRVGFRTDSSDAASHFDLLRAEREQTSHGTPLMCVFFLVSPTGETRTSSCVFFWVFPTVGGVVRKGIGAKYAQAYPFRFRAK